jgi:hypothetical protein
VPCARRVQRPLRGLSAKLFGAFKWREAFVPFMSKQARIVLKPDLDADNPLEGSGWEVVSFLNRANNPADYQSIGVKRKLATGTAFILKCYRHGCEVWSLQGDGRFYHHGSWDTSNGAGLLLFKGNPKDMPKGMEARQKMAQETIDTYSTWVNGGAVGWVLETEDVCDQEVSHTHHTHKHVVDSCWGYYDRDHAIEAAREMAKHHGFEVSGVVDE